MKKKKLICIALASVFAMSAGLLAACGDDDNGGGDGGDGELKPVSELYPNDFDFEPINWQGSKVDAYGGHDPVMVEAFDGNKPVYYSFSTDNATGGFVYGVQVRKSDDMIEWTKVGSAIKGFNSLKSENAVKSYIQSDACEIKEPYTVVSSFPDWSNPQKGPCWTLWAPDVIPAPTNTGKTVNGGWWLYSSWTAGFGSDQSLIFKLHSDNVAGPYEYDGIIVQNSANDGGINEIDPSLYWSADGSKLYMSYGSFFGGIAVLELDPATGLRKSGESVTTPGTTVITGGRIEGSVVAYHKVNIYTGDIGAADEDESKWTTKSQYYMMGSDENLSKNYTMRVWTSDNPDSGFTSIRGNKGLQVGGAWTWRKQGEPTLEDLNYYIPGHNDMLTTKDGRNLIVYHNRTEEGSDFGGNHYTYTSLYDFNSKGQLVISANRYAGERIGLVTAADVTSLTNGKYSVVKMTSSDPAYEQKLNVAYAQDCEFHADGTITGAVEGTWKVYGTHYVYIKLTDGTEYYGSAMPAFIRQYDANGLYGWKGNGGLTISAVTDTTTTGTTNGENGILYFNMQF